MIDILEQEIADISQELFDILLRDRTAKKNICWASDHYSYKGAPYYPQEPITQDLVTRENTRVIQARVAKDNDIQMRRTREKAEVFTPSWICNEQNNLIDEAWFGRGNVFNITTDKSWVTIGAKVEFPEGKTWKSYVDAVRLEVSCGEAPYLVSRYDTVTGEEIAVNHRIGILDRKIRVVNENTETEREWYKWIMRAYESTYGYEYQGDNILIARENLLYTFIENMKHKFSREPSSKQLKTIARIISWNIWQMDGITFTVPFSERQREPMEEDLFADQCGIVLPKKEPIPCRIFDWRSNKSIEFKSMFGGEKLR